MSKVNHMMVDFVYDASNGNRIEGQQKLLVMGHEVPFERLLERAAEKVCERYPLIPRGYVKFLIDGKEYVFQVYYIEGGEICGANLIR